MSSRAKEFDMRRTDHNYRRGIIGMRVLFQACILTALFAPKLHAEIVHGYFVWFGAPQDELALDRDGIVDVTVLNDCRPGIGCAITIFAGLGGGVALGSDNLAAGFIPGEEIREDLTWGPRATLCYCGIGCLGVFCEPPPRFVGLRFVNNDGLHY